MDADRRDAVVRYCRDQVGDPLRSVLTYEVDGTEVQPSVLYVRDDVRAQYPDQSLEDAARTILEEIALEGLSRDWLEHLHRFGPMQGTVRVFDRATVVHCWEDDAGVSLGWDTGASVDVEPFVRGLHETAMASDAA